MDEYIDQLLAETQTPESIRNVENNPHKPYKTFRTTRDYRKEILHLHAPQKKYKTN